MKEVERLRAAQGSEKHTEQCVEIALLLGHAGFPEDIPIQEAVRQLIQRVREGDKMNLTELVKRLVKAEADIQRSGRAETLRDEKAYSDGKAAGIRYALAEIKQTQINEVTDVIIAYFEGLKAPVPSTLNNPDCPPGLAAVRDYLAAPQGAGWRDISTIQDEVFIIGAWMDVDARESGELSREGSYWFDITGAKHEPYAWMPLPVPPNPGTATKE